MKRASILLASVAAVLLAFAACAKATPRPTLSTPVYDLTCPTSWQAVDFPLPLSDADAVRRAVLSGCATAPGRNIQLQASVATIESTTWGEYGPSLGDTAHDYPNDEPLAIVTLTGIEGYDDYMVVVLRRTGDIIHGRLRPPPPPYMATPTPTPYVNACSLAGPPPTPTPRPTLPTPTPTPTVTPGGPGEVASPPEIEIPAIPDLPVPEAASAFVEAVVSIAVYPPSYYHEREYHTAGLLISADGLALTVLNYAEPMERIEVRVPGHGSYDAAIVRVDPSTSATLLRIDASRLPFSSIEGDVEVALGEPVWLLRPDPDTGKVVVREGYAAPATNEGARDTMFGLLPGGFFGHYGTLAVSRDGALLGMVGTGSWYGTGLSPLGPYPGPAQPVVKTARLHDLIVNASSDHAAYTPAAVAYHTHTASELRGWLGDAPVLRESMAGPVEKVLRSLGAPVDVDNLGQTDNAVLGDRIGTFLEMVFAQPQELRTATGELVGKARYVAFWWGRENGEPDVVLCGAEPGYICGAFLAGDLSDLKAVVEAAPESGRSGVMTDAYSLPGYPSQYPLEMRVTTSSESYHPGEAVTFVVTIENHSAWLMNADHLPPGIVIQTKDRSQYWLQASEAQVSSLTIPAQDTVTLEFPWQTEAGPVSSLPPGEYDTTITWIPVGGYRQELQTDKFTILEE